jgi:hypothetical protein
MYIINLMPYFHFIYSDLSISVSLSELEFILSRVRETVKSDSSPRHISLPVFPSVTPIVRIQ